MYSTALGMEINMQKSTLAFNRVEEEHVRDTLQLFPFHKVGFQYGNKYLGLLLKSSDHRNKELKVTAG